MQDNLKWIEKQIENNRIEAANFRQQSQAERGRAVQFDPETQQGDINFHNQQADELDDRADKLEEEAKALEPKKVEIEARVAELKTERERINRETVDRTLAIDKELARLQGSMTI